MFKRQNKKNEFKKGEDFSLNVNNAKSNSNNNVFVYSSPLNIEEFAYKIGTTPNEIIKRLFMKGKVVTINTVLTLEQMGELSLEYNFDFQIKKEDEKTDFSNIYNFDKNSPNNVIRPPIVTIMGHVDHGKTTLIDALKKTNIISKEKGGITQHIGAYQYKHNDKLITFIDTPGHEAFAEMRARGVNFTDIVVLVIAADDGLMPQTEEAIDHIKYANVPIIVFINKMDKPNANPDLILSQLSNKNIIVEEWDGDTILVKGSALKREGINELLDAILTLSELKEYKSNPDASAYGVIVESHIDKGFGPQANVIVLQGTLKTGDFVIAGSAYGKIRVMLNEYGEIIKTALPSTPVKISGFNILPNVGEKFICVSDEKAIKNIIQESKIKQIKLIQQEQSTTKEIRKKTQLTSDKIFNLIVKSDFQGSSEAIKNLLSKIKIEGIVLDVIRYGIGPVTETDVRLAQVSKSTIFTFNVSIPKSIRELADSLNIKIYPYDVIYKLQDDLINLLKRNLDPLFEEVYQGEAIVRKTWHHSKIGTIAGCYIKDGIVSRNSKCKIIRDGIVIYQSSIESIHHMKEVISSAKAGEECGIIVKNFFDFKENDLIQSFKVSEISKDMR